MSGFKNNSGRQVAVAGAVDLRTPDIAVQTTTNGRSGGIVFIPETMAQAMEVATMMAMSGTAVRKHLRNNPGACFMIAGLAYRTGLDPYQLAAKSYEINDQIAYEAQAVAAIVIKNAPISDRPTYEYFGAGPSRRCKVTFKTNAGQVLTYESPDVKDIHPKNSPLWKSDVDQQLGYYSIRAAGRKHFPDIMMGVVDVEEAESMRDVTPRDVPEKRKVTSALDALQSKRPEPGAIEIDAPAEGFEDGKPSGGEPLAHDEDGVIAEDGGSVAPEMPEDMHPDANDGRWGKAFKWIKQQADEVDAKTLKFLLFRHSDILDKAAAYNDAGKAEVAAIRAEAEGA